MSAQQHLGSDLDTILDCLPNWTIDKAVEPLVGSKHVTSRNSESSAVGKMKEISDSNLVPTKSLWSELVRYFWMSASSEGKNVEDIRLDNFLITAGAAYASELDSSMEAAC
ncbi:hypothetical protein AMATHDRAFT_5851 [Amanita thiersii Skay4041]|uniref:Uncharacterized protein n=1 Tax=Amanita thiersii Skay4041 TaxID=703135 RepID=A0A2A9NBG5_9AGAR|nr:hypothetical protein AMATHDRAFT_5851 [Amanita thiersii Skay4041]